MSNTSLLGALSLFTLLAVLAFGFWQYSSVRRSQGKRGEETGTMTHQHFSADGDFVAPHDPGELSGAAGLHPEPVGADNTRAATRPPA